jgi:electron transfer flavoprotein alpha subunit
MLTRAAVIGADERSTRALLSVLPPDEPVLAVQLGPIGEAAIRRLPVAAVAHNPDVDVQQVAAADLADLIAGRVPAAGVVVLDSAQWSRDVAGCLAQRHGAAVVWAVDRISFDFSAVLADRVVLGGSHRLVHRIDPRAGMTIVLAKPISADNRLAQRPPAVTVAPTPFVPARVRVRAIESRELDGSAVVLPAARVVVCIGRGIGGADHVPLFAALAARLGGALGATRAAVDAGWLPFAHQIGQTGETVAPDLYLGFGVSGAAQHLAGMRESKRIVAINTDVDAALCRFADVVVEGSAVEVGTRLLAMVDGARPWNDKGGEIDV